MDSTTTPAHAFDAAIALEPRGDGRYTGHTHPAYANMVGPFGGTISATLLNAVMSEPARLGEPLSLTVHFAAPITDGAFSVHAKAMRTNRSTQHWLVELTQDDGIAAYATLVTARRRHTWAATDAAFPQVPAADRVEAANNKLRGTWTACYEMRFIDGEPLAGEDSDGSSLSRLWIRDDPPRPLDFLSLSAICDGFFPRIFVRRRRLVPMGTVALTTYFHADAEQLRAQGSAPLLGVARALHFGGGFHDQSAELWSAEGALLAASHQIVYFKE